MKDRMKAIEKCLRILENSGKLKEVTQADKRKLFQIIINILNLFDKC